MSDSSDISDFESVVEDDIEEKSNSSSSSEEDSDENEMIDSVKASASKNKSFQRKNKNDDGARITRKIRYIYPPGPGEKDERISPHRMTIFEYASLIGERAEMISRGAKIHPKYANYPTVDLEKIARLEIEDNTIPFPLMLKRPIDNPTYPTIVEIFRVREILTPTQRLTNHIEKYTPINNWRVFD